YVALMSVIDQARALIKKQKTKEKIDYTLTRTEPQRMVNEAGLRVITTILRGYLNKNIILSNLDSNMINKVAMDNTLDIIRFIYMTYDKYEIKKENFSVIVNLIDNNVYSALLRAKDGFFVNHLSTTQRYIEQSSVTTQDKIKEKKKLLPNLFGNWGDRGE
ncbi:unnamed protein product, partial [marine sediment metagenome]